MQKFFLPIFLGLVTTVFGQDTTATLQFSGYAEAFFAHDFNRPAVGQRPAFLYNHNRQNEFNANLAFLKANWSDQKTRANLAFAAGTYVSDNYAAEPQVLKNIFEANVGLKLGKNWWLDAGILPSHIGFESAVSKDCWTLTRSLAAENSPYFEAGAKLTFSKNEKWTLAALVLNGWQKIARTNSSPAFGTQVLWKPDGKKTLNWSTYFGNERPDTARQWRVFNDFYGIFQLSEKVGLTAGFDIGAEKTRADDWGVWYSPVAILQFKLSEKWAVAGRIENFTDEVGAIIAPDFSVSGGSVNVDFLPTKNAALRFELRFLGSGAIFFKGKTAYGTRLFMARPRSLWVFEK